MEDGLRDFRFRKLLRGESIVLILVLMEDGLRVFFNPNERPKNCSVLILVLVEDGLRAEDFFAKIEKELS